MKQVGEYVTAYHNEFGYFPNSLTMNKKYEVLAISKNPYDEPTYIIENDDGDKLSYHHCYFRG